MKKTGRGTIKTLFNALKQGRVLYTLIVTILTFSMVVVSSFAWLTLNRKTDVDEMGMALAVDDTSAVYEAYMYDLKSAKGTNLNADGEKLNVANIDLNQYDTIFKGQNKYTPIVVKITLLSNEAMPKSGTVHITIERDNLDPAGDSLTAFSSSIVRFTAFVLPDKQDVTMTAPDDLYSHVSTTQRFNEVEGYTGNDRADSKTFVTVNGTGEGHTHSKNTSLTVSTTYQESGWYYDENGDEALNVYLYITYDVQLVECYMEENTSGGLSLEDNSVFFENDMKKISVSYSAND